MNEDGPNSCMIINRSSLGSRTVATATHNNLQILQNDRVSIHSTGSPTKCRFLATSLTYSELTTFSKLSEKQRLQSLTAEPSEDTLDEIIRSYPSPMKFVTPYAKEKKTKPLKETESESFQHIIDLLHHEDEFLMAAEVGDEDRLKEFIARGVDVHQTDSLGRNALHMAVGTGNTKAVLVLLKAGVNPRVKDQIGLTPLSLCLMRRPSWRMASMLFDYGAKILPRNAPTDTGLFLQSFTVESTILHHQIYYILHEHDESSQQYDEHNNTYAPPTYAQMA